MHLRLDFGFVVPLDMLFGAGFVLIYWRYLRIRFSRAFLLAVAAGVAAIIPLVATNGWILDRTPSMESVGMSDAELYAAVAWIIMIMCGLGLLAKLYQVWIRDGATAAEREPNGQGIRAWLTVGNLAMGILFVAAAFFARGWNPVGTSAMVIGLLLAYPLVNCVLKSEEAPVNTDGEEVAEERRRVLAMVEAGKITGEDGAELIGALGQSHLAAAPMGLSLSGKRRVMMLGAVLVVVGFCLPWFTINTGQQAQEIINNMRQAMPQGIPLPPGYPVTVQTALQVRGGDIGYGLGWIILAMSIAVALLPLVWPARRENRDQQRAATLIGMIVGTVLVIYLAANAFQIMDIGMVVVMAGYVVEWVGVAREHLLPARAIVVAVQ